MISVQNTFERTSPATRRIWRSTDAILLLAAGAAAEIAGSKAVDWMFWTRRLPDAPLERMLESVRFAQRVFCSDVASARAAIAKTNATHRRVEDQRGERIPEWAYRDMLYMFIDYGERAHNIVYGPMSLPGRRSYCEDVLALGEAMQVSSLPRSYEEYKEQRSEQLQQDYQRSALTHRLNHSYRVALGSIRFSVWIPVQVSLMPDELREILAVDHHRNRAVEHLLRRYRYLPGGGRKLGPLYGFLLPSWFAAALIQVSEDQGTSGPTSCNSTAG